MTVRWARTRSLVLRALGWVALCAFLSLWVQIDGLIGSQGILPFADAVPSDLWKAPSFLWWWPVDGALHLTCAAGTILSLALGLGKGRPGPIVLALWGIYLSLASVGQIFLGYQWDTLLLETLFICALLAPWRSGERSPTLAGIWFLRITLFKLMLGSGLVKLLANDLTWWNGTALAYHYWTQPLPNPLSWYAHHTPTLWHSFETYLTLGIELVLPFCIFFGRWGRRLAIIGFTAVLAILFTTGNYGFFQILSMVLVLSLLDDHDLQRLWPNTTPTPTKQPGSIHQLGAALLLFGLLITGFTMEYGRLIGYRELHPTALELARVVHPWRTLNAYGLFGNMTEHRPELLVEGSDDGKVWKPYTFRYKPGPLDRTPPILGPHMPRLDWQLWFAALRSCKRAPWVRRLLHQLQRNEPSVLGLIAHNPFPEDGPRFIRARRVEYVFTAGGSATWNVIGEPKPYCPVQKK